MTRDPDVQAAIDAAVPPPTEDDAYALAMEVVRLGGENHRLREQYEQQLQATRDLDDIRMREIGDLQRELAKVRAEVAEEIAQAIEVATGTGAYISRATAAQVARDHGKER